MLFTDVQARSRLQSVLLSLQNVVCRQLHAESAVNVQAAPAA